MKKLLCLLLLTTSVNASVECPTLSEEQLEILEYSYHRGAPYDLGYTLATIAFQESDLGVNIVNAYTGDYGIYQGNYKTICRQSGITSRFLCNKEIQKVILNREIASEHALHTLTWWESYYKKRVPANEVYEYTIRSYNAGFSPEIANSYWEEYKIAFNTIKECFL